MTKNLNWFESVNIPFENQFSPLILLHGTQKTETQKNFSMYLQFMQFMPIFLYSCPTFYFNVANYLKYPT